MEDTQFIVWDLETTGLNVWFDVPLTGAFVLCDQNLNIKDKFTFKCKLPQGVVPSPIALLVNNIDPQTIYFSYDTKLGRDVTVGPHVVFGPAVTIANNVTIRPFCHIEGAKIAEDAVVGPFARLRPGTNLAEDVRVGNFVEIKNITISGM